MSSHVRAIQTVLQQHGFYRGQLDGIAGPQTVEAVNRAIEHGKVTRGELILVEQQNRSDPNVEGSTLAPSVPLKKLSGFSLSDRSKKNLQGVHPDLVKVVERAIQLTPIDFTVIEGLRTKARQQQLVKSGASKTMNSRHLTGHAVDIAPMVNGSISWDFNHYYPLAEAMAKAATELGVTIRWGGCWSVITNKAGTAQSWVQAYRKGGGRFLDGPHFEIPA